MASQRVVRTVISVTLCALFVGILSQDEDLPWCEESRTIFRNSNRTCPDRAVCADVFRTVRNWYGYQNRPPCRDHRVIHQCMCPGEQGSTHLCPIEDGHELFASRRHVRYTCRPVCSFPYCDNVSTGRQRSRGRDANSALTMFQRSPGFGGRNYYRVDCRCPRHHQPSSRRGVHRAVEAYGTRYDFMTDTFSTVYRCINTGPYGRMDDPCGRVQNQMN